MLTQRWEGASGGRLAAAVLDCLTRPRRLRRLGFQEVGGRIDLRFLVSGELRTFGGGSIEGVDLSGARFRSARFTRCTVVDSVLDGSSFTDLRVWRTELRDSSFRGSVFAGSNLGANEGRKTCAWDRCDLTASHFSDCSYHGARISRCGFHDVRLTDITFRQCRLEDVVFSGQLRRVLFEGRDIDPDLGAGVMSAVDLRGSRFEDVEFRGSTLEGVSLPRSPDVFRVGPFGAFDDAVRATLTRDTSELARLFLAYIGNVPRDPRDLVVLNLADFDGVRAGLRPYVVRLLSSSEVRPFVQQ